MTLPVVQLHAEDDGTITTPFGPIGDLKPCVLIGEDIVEGLRDRYAPLCSFARNLLGPGGMARIDGDMLTVDARDRLLHYRIHPAEWDDDIGRISTSRIYLGVLQPQTGAAATLWPATIPLGEVTPNPDPQDRSVRSWCVCE